MAADYQNKFDTMKVSRTAAVEASARRIVSGFGRYLVVSKLTGVPPELIGVLHDREASCDFRGCLANGDNCIGNGRRTHNEPRGLGPYSTWEESALDALRREGFLSVHDWSPGVMAFEGERFNGEGYHNHGWSNPYLWGGCQYYTRGKYVRDGVYDPSFVDPQVGIMPIIKRVLELTNLTVVAKPVVIKANPDTGKLHPADKAVVVSHSRVLRVQEWYANFCKYLGLSGASLGTLIPTIGNFLTDWRTLTVAGVLGGGWLVSEIFKYNLLSAAAAGRYIPSGMFDMSKPITAADGDTASASPPAPMAEPLAPDTAAVPSAPVDPVQGLGTLQEAA